MFATFVCFGANALCIQRICSYPFVNSFRKNKDIQQHDAGDFDSHYLRNLILNPEN